MKHHEEKNNNRKCDVEGDQFTDSANGQPLNFLKITYLVGKMKFKLFFHGPLAE